MACGDNDGVYVKPSVVMEVTYQETDEYTSGYALRVLKIVRFRPDKKFKKLAISRKLHKLFELQCERHPFKSL